MPLGLEIAKHNSAKSISQVGHNKCCSHQTCLLGLLEHQLGVAVSASTELAAWSDHQKLTENPCGAEHIVLQPPYWFTGSARASVKFRSASQQSWRPGLTIRSLMHSSASKWHLWIVNLS
jgi:hypothetical protein